MRVIVLGSGVIGVCTAYYLARAGHEVIVLDRQAQAAQETSYANAGEISPGYAAPWAAPGIPLKALKWLLFDPYSPLVIHPRLDWAMWRWLWLTLRQCTTAHYQSNKASMVRLAEYSRDCLRELRDATHIEYEQRTLGTLQLFRTQQQWDAVGKDISTLQAQGVPFHLLDQAGVIRHEPALARVAQKFVGGLHLPADETGDCFKFTQALAAIAAADGVDFRYHTTIRQLLHEGQRVNGVLTDAGVLQADACVVALGSYSPLLLKPLGIDLPIYPLKGYSLTAPVTDADAAPASTVMDESHKVAITRLGTRIRAGGTAELAGYDLSLPASRCAVLRHVVDDLFPDGCDTRQAHYWAGLRPMTPDGKPRLGASPYAGLFLATGHGTLGWTMAAGTGRILADLISAKTPAIDLSGLTLDT
jgi:D-amino-acid dehydrogenase